LLLFQYSENCVNKARQTRAFFMGGGKMTGIARDDLKHHVIRPSLQKLDLWSKAAENLLLATCAHESLNGFYLKQRGGCALSIFQIEPATHTDVWRNYLTYRPLLAAKVNTLVVAKDNVELREQELITNLAYATAIARIIYLRVPAPLPYANDIPALAQYWKQHYNTSTGKGDSQTFITHAQGLSQ